MVAGSKSLLNEPGRGHIGSAGPLAAGTYSPRRGQRRPKRRPPGGAGATRRAPELIPVPLGGAARSVVPSRASQRAPAPSGRPRPCHGAVWAGPLSCWHLSAKPPFLLRRKSLPAGDPRVVSGQGEALAKTESPSARAAVALAGGGLSLASPRPLVAALLAAAVRKKCPSGCRGRAGLAIRAVRLGVAYGIG